MGPKIQLQNSEIVNDCVGLVSVTVTKDVPCSWATTTSLASSRLSTDIFPCGMMFVTMDQLTQPTRGVTQCYIGTITASCQTSC